MFTTLCSVCHCCWGKMYNKLVKYHYHAIFLEPSTALLEQKKKTSSVMYQQMQTEIQQLSQEKVSKDRLYYQLLTHISPQK